MWHLITKVREAQRRVKKYGCSTSCEDTSKLRNDPNDKIPATFIPLDGQNAFHYGSWITPLRREWQQIIAAKVLARQTREVFTVLFLSYIYIYVHIYTLYYLVLSYLILSYVIVLLYHIILHNIIYIMLHFVI